MKVFLSWSGELSRDVAEVFRDWLPPVIQAVKPYLSSADIDKGARWADDIAKELDDSSFGILCLTPDNLHADWVHFEAGALSKAVDKARVAPFLFGVKRAQISEPLRQFQSVLYDRDEVSKLVSTVNEATDNGRIEEGRLPDIFKVWWPQLKERLDPLKDQAAKPSDGGESAVPATGPASTGRRSRRCSSCSAPSTECSHRQRGPHGLMKGRLAAALGLSVFASLRGMSITSVSRPVS